jgi:hypothetical protein
MGRGVLRIEVTRAGCRGVGGVAIQFRRKKRFLCAVPCAMLCRCAMLTSNALPVSLALLIV